MTRADAIAQIAANAEKLDDDQLEGLAALTEALLGPSAYSTLSPADRPRSMPRSIGWIVARAFPG